MQVGGACGRAFSELFRPLPPTGQTGAAAALLSVLVRRLQGRWVDMCLRSLIRARHTAGSALTRQRHLGSPPVCRADFGIQSSERRFPLMASLPALMCLLVLFVVLTPRGKSTVHTQSPASSGPLPDWLPRSSAPDTTRFFQQRSLVQRTRGVPASRDSHVRASALLQPSPGRHIAGDRARGLAHGGPGGEKGQVRGRKGTGMPVRHVPPMTVVTS